MNRDKQDALAWFFLAGGLAAPACRSRGDHPEPLRCHGDRAAAGGFTLIEVMITCAIIAILSAIAYPSYANFVLRGKLVGPTNELTAQRALLEQYFQDNRTYANVSTTIISPCNLTPKQLKDFAVVCAPIASPEGYTITATGSKPATMGFEYSITNADEKSSIVGSVWGGTTCTTAWIIKNGDPC